MPNLQNQLATTQLNLSVVHWTKLSDNLVNQELSLISGQTNLVEAYVNLSPKKRQKSIIYKSISTYLKNYLNNKEDIEDIISEAFYLLRKASFKYFETPTSYI